MNPARILVVDDEIIIARDLEVRLQRMGYEVVGIGASGTEAIALAGQFLPDIVLMDIVLKGEMDGIDAATVIRQRYQAPIIYVTAYTDTGTLRRAMVTEPFGYIVKPFLEREIKANIEMALYKHRMEKRLRGIEQWFSHALEGNAEGVIFADPESRITVLNPVGESITAWPREMALGKPLGEVLRLVGTDGLAVDCAQVAEGPIVRMSEDTRLLDRTGTAVPLDSMTSGVRDKDNQLAGSISVFRDASGRRVGKLVPMVTEVSLAVSASDAAGLMLQRCAESIERNLNVATAQIWLLDARDVGLKLMASAGLARPAEPDNNHASQHPLEARIAQTLAPVVLRNLSVELEGQTRDWAHRERLLTYAGYPLRVENQLLGVVSIYSRYAMSPAALESLEAITQTIAVGAQRKSVEEQLRQSQKMEAVGQLAAGVAHDFNNILMVVLGCSELLLETPALDDEHRQMLTEIRDAGGRAASLTRQLLAFSRRQVVSPVLLSINDTVSGMEKMLHRIIGEDITLNITLQDSVHTALIDPGLLEQVLLNLAVNARDAMPRGGTLTIETCNMAWDEATAALHVDGVPGSYVRLTVRDTGLGIPPEVLPRIFEPFYSTKAHGRGTGLGLSTAYGIVKQANGYIDVFSEVDAGSTFRIYLPAQSAAPPQVMETRTRSASKGHETILVVEDDPVVRGFVVNSLHRAGYHVLAASDGEEALQFGNSYDAPIHLLLTDVVMAGMAGRELVERWRPLRPESAIMLMSGYTDDAVVRHGILQSNFNFLQKPFTPSVLSAKIREVLDEPSPAPGAD
jgi:PAS domain S-box-containing protein